MLEKLTADEQNRVRWVLGWIDRMCDKYGGTCREKNGKTWDWGQALCRLCYGSDWNNIISKQNIETPTWEDIEKAKKWENGKMPNWFQLECTKCGSEAQPDTAPPMCAECMANKGG